MAAESPVPKGGGESPTSRTTDGGRGSALDLQSSLLDIIEENFGERKFLLHRITTILKHKTGANPADIGAYYEKFVTEMKSTDTVTGLLLVYPMHSIHVLEGTTEALLTYAKNLRSQLALGSAVLIDRAKFLCIAHNIDHALFQGWNYKILDIRATGIGEYETTEAIENTVHEVLVQILKIGVYLSKQPKLSYGAAIGSLREKVPELLPPQDVLEYLVSGDDTALIEVQQYISRYEKPFDVILDNELVWPMPDHLLPNRL